jgi:uncharacterized phiE125 gp8 family phage protein
MVYVVSAKHVTQTVAPEVEPVTLDELKAHLQISTADHDTTLTAIGIAAREWAEAETRRAFVQRTYRANVSGFAYRYRLPFPELRSATVQYYNTDSPEALTAYTGYRVHSDRSELELMPGSTLPTTAQRPDAVQITYVAGYADDAASPVDYTANVPHMLRHAILMAAADMFENREGQFFGIGFVRYENPTLKAMLAPYRDYI